MLEEILQKPEEYRKRVAFIATGFIGVIIVSAWLIIASFRIKQAIRPEEERLARETFENSLPSIRQDETVVTELEKQGALAAKASGSGSDAKDQKLIGENEKMALSDKKNSDEETETKEKKSGTSIGTKDKKVEKKSIWQRFLEW